jgi:hypothetical protein
MRKLLAAFGAVLDLVERVRSAVREPVYDWRADRQRADARRAMAVVLAHDTAEIEAWFRLATSDLNLAIASIRARSVRAGGDRPLSTSEVAALTSLIGLARTTLDVHGPQRAKPRDR